MDRTLVARAQAGDQDAYAALAREAARPVYLVAYRILRDADAAEDAAQAALVAMWREIGTLTDLDRFEAWCHRLAVNAAIDEQRRGKRHRHLPEIDANERGGPDESRGVALRDQLDRAFRQLSPEHRTVVVLHHYAGYSLGEIAELLEVPYGTVGSRLHHATRQLRTALRWEDPEPIAEGGTA